MLHGKVLRSPLAHARIVSIDTSARRAHARRRLRPDRRRPRATSTRTRGHAIRDRPIVAIDRVRFHGEPVAAVAAETRRRPRRRSTRSRSSTRSCRSSATLEEALAPDAPLVHDGPLRAGPLPRPRRAAAERDGQRLLPLPHRPRRARGGLRARGHRRRGRVHVPGRLPVRDGDAHGVAQVEGDEITLWATCQHPFLVRAEIADLFGVPLANVRIIVPYLGGGFGSKSYTKMEPHHGRARAQGRPARCGSRTASPSRWSRRAATACAAACARRRRATAACSAREVECWFDTGAYADNGPRVTATGGDAAPGPVPLGGLPRRRRLRLHEHRAVGLLPRLRRDAPAVDRRVAGRRGRPPRRARPARRPPPEPLHARRGGARRRQAARRRPRRRRREGRRRRSAGTSDEAAGTSAAASRSACSPPARIPVSSAVVRLEADGSVVVLVGTTEMGQGPRTVFAQIAAEELGVDRRARDRARRRHALHAVRPLDRREPLDDARRASPSSAPPSRHPRAARARSPAATTSSPTTYLALMRTPLRLRRRRADRPRRGRPEGTGSYAEGPVFWEVCVGAAEVEVDPETGRRPRARGRRPWPTSAGRSTRSSSSGRTRARRCRGSATRSSRRWSTRTACSLNDTLLDYRVPSFEDLPDEMTCVIVENGDGPGPYGAKGCGEGALAAVPAAIVNALADAGVPDDRAAADAGARLAAHPGAEEGGHVADSETRSGDRHRDDGPRHGRGARPRRDRDGALRRQRRGARAGEGRRRAGRRACSSGSRRRAGGRRLAPLRERPRGGARGRRLRARGGARRSSS